MDIAMTDTATAPTSTDQQAPNAAELNASAIAPDELERLTEDIVAALKTVYDPEIPVDIYELGLIYKVDIDDNRKVTIHMTLTAPGCPVAGEMPGWVENAVATAPGVSDVQVEMVFDPPWTPERMSEEAQVAIGWF
jgi:FeS assembly SUF system protein